MYCIFSKVELTEYSFFCSSSLVLDLIFVPKESFYGEMTTGSRTCFPSTKLLPNQKVSLGN